MKTIFLGSGQKKTEVTIMDKVEFKSFLKGKTVYHRNVYWYEKWNQSVMKYFPAGGFLIDSSVRLERYYPSHGYSSKCLSASVKGGGGLWELPRWKVTIRETKNKVMYYVTAM